MLQNSKNSIHNNHKELIDLNHELIDPSKARTENENINLAIYLIKNNIKEDLDFHFTNFYKNKIFWKKSKISKYKFNIREQKFPKDELFLNSFDTIRKNQLIMNLQKKIFVYLNENLLISKSIRELKNTQF